MKKDNSKDKKKNVKNKSTKIKEENNKNNKKNDKPKKKKSIVGRILKFVLVTLLIAIIVVIAYFGFNYIKLKTSMGDSEYDPLSATALGIDANKLKDVGRINILVLGESNANQGSNDKPYYLTDTIMVLSYNPQTQQASILSIPRDTYVGKKNRNSATANYLQSYKMNAVYRNRTNIDETLKCVSELLGINLESYIMIDTDAIVDVVDAIGGVWFNVPIDMNYDDYNQDLHIHLTAGEQLINGDKAEQLLRFRHNQDGTSYPTEYGDNDIGRMRTQREFIMSTAKKLLKIENVTKVLNLLDIMQQNVRTNMDFQEFKYYIPYIFKFDTSSIKSSVVPGVPETCNGVSIYVADKTVTKKLVEELYTDKVKTETNTNTQNTNTETNSTANITSSTTTNSIASSKTKNITIELLNGTSNEQTLNAVKEKLKRAGYTISKTDATTKTQKTTIINRTSQKSEKSKTLQSTLGVGTITTGSNNARVDYTIIIGEDYK